MRYLLLLLLPLVLVAQILAVGDKITPRQLEDQFEQKHQVGGEKLWVLTWDRETARIANDYFEKEPSALKAEKVAMTADFSTIPSGILSLFVMPRMQGYTKHRMLLSYDEQFNAILPYKEEHLTILHPDNTRITKIDYIESEEELANLLQSLSKK